jgi:transposase
MLQQLVAGDTDPAVLAELARGRLRAKIPQLVRALNGRIAAHQRFLLAQQLAHLAFLDEAIEHVSGEITERVGPVEPAVAHLDTIPGWVGAPLRS